MKRFVMLCCILSVGLLWSGGRAQTNVNMGSQTTVTGCDINIYDDGGPNGAYGSNHNYTLTIYPTANQGRVFLEINALDIHHNDTLFIYDGPTATGTPIAALNDMTYNPVTNFNTYMASQSNTSGALTLRFKVSYFISLITNHGAGFSLHASCVAPCNPFQIVLDTAHCSHTPVLHPDDGYLYVDVCPGEAVQLAVNGIYSNQQAAGYTQTDANSTFVWELEPDVTLSGTGLDQVTHTFTPGIGSQVTVTATDTLHCPASQSVNFRVRVSENPVYQIPPMSPMCKGQTFVPEIGYTNSNDIVLQEVGHAQHASLTVSDTVFLPDGDYCPPYGLYYRSTVTFTEFAPGATLSSANDILYVRIKMEHSAIEDLKIDLFCPNGSSSTILPNPNWDNSIFHYYRVNLGSAYRPDGGSCNAALNPMGDPWNYVWSNNSTLGYQYAPGNGSCYNTANFHAHYNPHWDASNSEYFGDMNHSYSVDSSNVANMTQIYHPYQSFNSLVGCPLNGNWYIQVQDMLPEDNGYIVEWELALNPDLMPSIWEYSVGIDTFYLTGNQIVNGNTIQPMTTGNPSFGATFIDDFGCQYDTVFHITVYDLPEVSLGEDRQICNGQSVTLSPASTGGSYNYLWNTGATTPSITTSTPGSYSLSARVMQGLNVLCQSSDTVEVTENTAVTTTVEDEVCAGENYSGFGFAIGAAELGEGGLHTATRTLAASNGCDSVVTLNLTVQPRYHDIFTQLACEEYTWEGETYTESGEYTRNYTSSKGCDSVLTLRLSIGHPSQQEIEVTSCGPHQWNGEIFYETGIYERTLTSMHGCDSTVTLRLTVVDTMLRTASSNPDFCLSEETTITVEGNFDTYQWSTGEVGSSIFVTASGIYTVTATNYACERSATVYIPFCTPTLLLPNAITPGNGDGLNDGFTLSEHDRNQIVLFSIVIYNRWGELVFASEDKNFRWDGTKNGKRVPEAVYTYLIRCTDHTGRPYHLTGTVTVL